jgi:16S rRNA (guanine527-N7)-methyltransferase
MNVLTEYLLPLCRLGGHCLAQKGEDAPQEVAEAQEAISLLGGRVAQLTPVELPTVAETRYLVDIAKVAATPPAYPRRAGRPAKRPL